MSKLPDIKPHIYKTRTVVEHLLKISENFEYLRKIFKISSIINEDSRNWGAKDHSGEVFIEKEFSKPNIFVVKSKLISVFIITPHPVKRLYSMIQITGNQSMYYHKVSMSNIISMMVDMYLFNRESLSNPIYNQLFVFAYEEKEISTTSSNKEEYDLLKQVSEMENQEDKDDFVNGVLFTELDKNLWTQDEDYYIITKNRNLIKKSFKALVTILFKNL